MCVTRLQEPCEVCWNDNKCNVESIALQLYIIMDVAAERIKHQDNVVKVPFVFQVLV